MVEVTLDNGLKGVGEGYLAVFAPLVFREIVQLVAPYVEGRYLEEYKQIIADLQVLTGYWSRQGAACHVLSAIDIALYDLLSQIAGKPLFKYLNLDSPDTLELYASGGDSQAPADMMQELDEVRCLGIQSFKIRARKEHVYKANWCICHAHEKGIKIAVDMTQNLVVPGQTVEDVVRFRESLCGQPFFIEEPLGPARIHEYPALRQQMDCPVAGGEIITHPDEMTEYIRNGYYDIAQP
ncbi:MAG: enolase C-terminal domain-like protein [Mangrovibacterium sp.]